MENNFKSSYYQFIYKNVQEHIKLADNKIAVLMAFYVANLGLYVSKIEELKGIFYGKIFIIIFILISMLLFISIFLALIPRIRTKKILKDQNYQSKIFFNDIAKNNREILDNLTEEEFLTDLKNQIYINSKIAEKKFLFVFFTYVLILLTFIINIIIIHL